MEQDIIKLLQIINEKGIKISNDIAIADGFSLISTTVGIISTIIATVLGGWLTIGLFKKQERMRIRQELILDFIKEYNKFYKELYELMKSLKFQMRHVYYKPDENGVYTTALQKFEKVEEANNAMLLNGEMRIPEIKFGELYQYQELRYLFDRLIEASKETLNKVDELRRFIDANFIIYATEDESYRKFIKNETEYKNIYEYMYVFIDSISRSMVGFMQSYEIFNEFCENNKNKYEKFDLLDLEDRFEMYSQMFIYNVNLDNVAKYYETFDSVMHCMENEYNGLQIEFLSSYFEKGLIERYIYKNKLKK